LSNDESEVNQPQSVKKANSLNNMPGFTIGAIQSLETQIKGTQILVDDFEIAQSVEGCFQKLIDILMKLSCKNGNRTQLRMILNSGDLQIKEKASKKSNKNSNSSKCEQQYLEIRNEFSEEILNEAK
jgi:hypothetical protein